MEQQQQQPSDDSGNGDGNNKTMQNKATNDAKLATTTTVTQSATNDTKYAHKTLQDYEVLSVIGNGCFGTCYKVRDKTTGTLYVWKGVDYDDDDDDDGDDAPTTLNADTTTPTPTTTTHSRTTARAALTREIALLRQLQHPNIVQYYHHLCHTAAKCIFIVMECCEGGDLAQLIARARRERCRFEERYVWRVLHQLGRALQLCHTRLRAGTLLHRDIKPANIFLDAAGNAKLGDFGLARLLRGGCREHRDGGGVGGGEQFARTIVGTPYYMSPELMCGVRYDRTSDVWSLGCLVYELCALRPPFRGRDCVQLSLNITRGQCRRIPRAFSGDLQAIIDCMLTRRSDERPGIEVITRHPLLVRHVSEDIKDNDGFPQLIDMDGDDEFDVEGDGDVAAGGAADLSSTSSLTDADVDGDATTNGRRRRLSVSDVFTPDLRRELFHSAKRRVQRQQQQRTHALSSGASASTTLRRSDSALYESIRRADVDAVLPTPPPPLQPFQLSQRIFDDALQQRLHAVRAHESVLQQREVNLLARESQLIEWEQRLLEKEHELLLLLAKLKQQSGHDTSTAPTPSLAVQPPPIPPRKPPSGSRSHDDTYCSIEPNDTRLQSPTMAKLNMAALPAPAPKAFVTGVRKVTFQSPKKFISYDIEQQLAPAPPSNVSKSATSQCSSGSGSGSATGSVHQLQTSNSSSSKSSNASHVGSTQQQHHHHDHQQHHHHDHHHRRRKSLLSTIFGLHRTQAKKSTQAASASETRAPSVAQSTSTSTPLVIAKCQTADLSSMWTKEHKRAAFDLLAAMNAAERCGGDGVGAGDAALPPARHKLRQSVRERNLQRNRLRRSMVAMPTMQTAAATNQRALSMAYTTAHDHIVV